MRRRASPAPGDVDRPDAGARVRAAQRRAPQHPLGVQVGRVRELARDLGHAVDRARCSSPTRRGAGSARRDASRVIVIARPPARGCGPASRRRRCAARRLPPRAAADQQRARPARRAEHERGDRVVDARAGRGRRAATARCRRACPARASRSRPARPRQLRAVDRPERERLAGGHRGRAAAQAREEQRLAHLGAELAGLVGGGAVDAEPDRRAGLQQRRSPARCPRRAARSSSGSARRRCRSRRACGPRSASRWTQCASQTSSPSQPSVVEVLDRAHAEPLAGRTPPRRASRPGACAAARRGGGRARPTSAISSRGDRERRARRRRAIRSIDAGRRVVEAVDRRLGWRPGWRRGPRRPRPAAGRRASAPRSIEPRQGWKRRPSSRAASISSAEQVAGAAREEVVVVGAGRAARARERGQARPRGRVATISASMPRPHRVERRSASSNSVASLGQPARGPLVEVVVAVDEARAWPGSRAPSMRRRPVASRRRARRRPRRSGRPRPRGGRRRTRCRRRRPWRSRSPR